MNKRTLLITAALCLAASASLAQAPAEPMRIVIPLGPGTPSDFATRIVAKAMSEELKRPIVIDNKPGANGVLAVQEVMRAKPDGNTLMLGGISPMALNMAVVKNLPYDPRRDLTAIGGIYNAFQAYVVSSTLPVNTFGEFIEYAKKNPGKVTIGHYSALSKIQFAALASLSNANVLMVPYKSTMPAVNDVMAGTIDASMLDVATALSLSKGGKMKPLAITLAERSPLAPGLPTASESVPGMAFPAWSGLVGPPGMARDTVLRLNAALNTALRNKDVVAALAEQAVQTWETTPEGFASHIDKEIARWTKLAKEAGVQPE
jgi:tripartite-type tricarboxylate transporter receptor subunit TctC